MQAMRGWSTRYVPWIGLVGFLGGAPHALAGDYEGSPQVAEFVGEMTLSLIHISEPTRPY